MTLSRDHAILTKIISHLLTVVGAIPWPNNAFTEKKYLRQVYFVCTARYRHLNMSLFGVCAYNR